MEIMVGVSKIIICVLGFIVCCISLRKDSNEKKEREEKEELREYYKMIGNDMEKYYRKKE